MKIMSYNNNFISITTGAGLAILTKINTSAIIFQPDEFFKVFVLGFIGGIGGYVGKIVVHKLLIKINQWKK